MRPLHFSLIIIRYYIYVGYLQLYTTTNNVNGVRTCSVTAVLWLQFVVHVMLFPMLSVLCFCIITFLSM